MVGEDSGEDREGMNRHVRTGAGIVLLAALTAACWWGWLAWDTEYQVDPTTGSASGPYEAWQVIGCVVCLAVLAVLAAVRLPALAVIVTMTLSFTAVWTWTAAGTDDTGLAGVGALLVFFGMACATGLVVPLVSALATRRPASRGTATAHPHP